MNIKQLHREAMSIAFDASMALANKDEVKAKALYNNAFVKELQAANKLITRKDLEPTRSILFRSAGWLAYKAGLYFEAVKMAEIALDGSPDKYEEEELQRLLQQSKQELR